MRKGGAGAHQFRRHLLGSLGGGGRRAGVGGSAGEEKTLKSGEVCAQLTAGRGKEGAREVSLLDFGEMGRTHGGKAVTF